MALTSRLVEAIDERYAIIYRLYDPAHFADPSYIGMDFDGKTLLKYTVRVVLQPTTQHGHAQTLDCPNFYHIYASNPFTTHTLVFSNPSF